MATTGLVTMPNSRRLRFLLFLLWLIGGCQTPPTPQVNLPLQEEPNLTEAPETVEMAVWAEPNQLSVVNLAEGRISPAYAEEEALMNAWLLDTPWGWLLAVLALLTFMMLLRRPR